MLFCRNSDGKDGEGVKTGIELVIAAAAAIILSGCAKQAELPSDSAAPVRTVASSSVSEVSTVTSTPASEQDTESLTVTADSDMTVSETVSETDQDISEEMSSEDISSEITADEEESVASSGAETISDSSRSEVLAASETSFETVHIETSAPPLSESAPATTPAYVEVPAINTGSFGRDVLENDYAYVDCSETERGVIKVGCKGFDGKSMARITCGGKIYDYNLSSSGSVLPLQMGDGTYNVKVLQNVSGRDFAIAYDIDVSVTLKDSFRPYLMPSQFIEYDSSSDCVYTAAQLCAGKKGDAEKAAAIFAYITSHISYDKELAQSVRSGYIPNPDRTLASGKGICFDYASLFAAMCRSQGMPTKLVMGYVSGDLYHAWNEIYIQGTGWITADLFLDKGWNLADPTLYASADDKGEVSKYIGDGSNYSTVYFY